ncbi:MAG: carbohydrate ABC transporter permease [Sphaerochaetaceae bacterium]|nr:carbohydrate ABC transporter permease [Sphaerochaetaceae bacterium]
MSEKNYQARLLVRKIGLTVFMILVSFTMVLPFLWMVSSSFKDSVSMFKFPIEWIPKTLNFSGYETVWKGQIPFSVFFINSLKVTFLAVVGTVISCSMGGYAYAKLKFIGRDSLFLAKLATMMIPSQITMLPTFMIFKWLGLINSHAALWIPFFLGQPFGTFLMRQYFLKVPDELLDSARIDGASQSRIFVTIAMPLVRAGLSVLVFLYFVWAWNNYEGPLLYIRSTTLYTLPLALKYFSDEFSTNYTAIMAASVSMTIPILFLFVALQRFFIEDITSTGLKG